MECILCKNIFSETILPIMLSCGHSTCNSCLVMLKQEGFPCPRCARTIQVSCPDLKLLSEQTKSNLNKNSSCDLCEFDCHFPSHKCIDCNKSFCDFWVQPHKRMKSTHAQYLVPISELTTSLNSNLVLPLLEPKRCHSHDQPYSHYNDSLAGSHLLCRDCAIEKAHLHSTSPFIPLSTTSLYEQKIQQARGHSPKVSEKIRSFTSTSQILSDKIKLLDHSRDLALGQIEQTFQTYRQALDAREEELKSHVEELHKSARFEIEEEAERMKLFVGQLEQYLKGLEEMDAAQAKTSSSSSSVSESYSSTSLSSLSSTQKSVLVDVCLLEASIRAFFSSSIEVDVPSQDWLDVRISKLNISQLGSVSLDQSSKKLPITSHKGQLEGVRILLDRGVDVNQRDENGWTALHWASYLGHDDIVSFLLDRGADISLLVLEQDSSSNDCNDELEKISDDNNGEEPTDFSVYVLCSALHLACDRGYLEIVTLLLHRGAKINEKDIMEWSPFYTAWSYGHLSIASLLLDRGANINEKDDYGNTQLHMASKQGRLSIVILLLDKGASINGKNQFGETPLKLAEEKKQSDVCALLREKGGTI